VQEAEYWIHAGKDPPWIEAVYINDEIGQLFL